MNFLYADTYQYVEQLSNIKLHYVLEVKSRGTAVSSFFSFWIYPVDEGKPVSQVKAVVISHFSPGSSQRAQRSGKNPGEGEQA